MYKQEIADIIAKKGFPSFRAGQVFGWLQKGARSFDEMTNLPMAVKNALLEEYFISTVDIENRFESQVDETVKYLFKLCDGEYIESVLMKYHHGYSVCVSTQVGCNMGCGFCASTMGGKIRNLSAGEILGQLYTIAKDRNIRVSNVVLMGMGEPLDNYESVLRFLKLVSSDEGLNIGMRHISLSTCGLVDKIDQLAEENLQLTLSVSLHAPNDQIRDGFMPINKKWNVEALLNACRRYAQKTGRRISFEYALIHGVNDTPECAKELALRLRGMLCHVNLIPVNRVEENSFTKPDRARVEQFCNALIKLGVNATIRRTLGSDIDASCGQLRRRKYEE